MQPWVYAISTVLLVTGLAQAGFRHPIEQTGSEALAIQTGDGVLAVERLKPEGGSSIAARDFLRGHPGIAGAVLR